MRRRIISMCYSLGWTTYNTTTKRTVVDMTRLEGWMMNYSYQHKPMSSYTLDELPKLVSQFEAMLKTVLP